MSADVSMFPSLAKNAANVPGGLGAAALDRPVEAGSLTWVAEDANPWGASIGYALAVECAASPDQEPSEASGE